MGARKGSMTDFGSQVRKAWGSLGFVAKVKVFDDLDLFRLEDERKGTLGEAVTWENLTKRCLRQGTTMDQVLGAIFLQQSEPVEPPQAYKEKSFKEVGEQIHKALEAMYTLKVPAAQFQRAFERFREEIGFSMGVKKK